MSSHFDIARSLDRAAIAFDSLVRTYDYRFVMVIVQHPDEGAVPFLRTGLFSVCRDHMSLVNALNIEIIHHTKGSEYPMQCVGGGFLRLNPSRKEITVYGVSGRYQKEPDRETRTVQMLQVLFPDFTISVDPADV